jgi:SAM-dependent methyltransferase
MESIRTPTKETGLSSAEMINRRLAASFLQRALAKASGGEDFLLAHAAADMTERLLAVDREFERAALIAPFPARAAGMIIAGKRIGALHQVSTLDAPDETLPLAPQSLDLVMSLLSLHVTNDVPGALIQMRRALKADGLMLAVMPGGETLKELRFALTLTETEMYGGASPKVLPFADVRAAGALLQRTGFALPVTDVETLTVRYDTVFGLMHDLRGMGAQNALSARSRRPVSRRFFQRAAEIYAENFSDADGRVRATFSFVSLSGWSPHESQQKPLKPGSAKVSLADFLGKA